MRNLVAALALATLSLAGEEYIDGEWVEVTEVPIDEEGFPINPEKVEAEEEEGFPNFHEVYSKVLAIDKLHVEMRENDCTNVLNNYWQKLFDNNLHRHDIGVDAEDADLLEGITVEMAEAINKCNKLHKTVEVLDAEVVAAGFYEDEELETN